MGKSVPPPPPELLRAFEDYRRNPRSLILSRGMSFEWLCQYCGSPQQMERVSCSQCGGPKPVAELGGLLR